MKKTGIILGFTLLLFFVVLFRHFLPEETMAIFLIPLIASVTVGSLLFLLARLFTRASYRSFIRYSVLASIILQFSILGILAWWVAPRYYNQAQIFGDIDHSVNIMHEMHPNLYHSISPEEFKLYVDSIKRTMPRRISDAEAFKTFRKIFSKVSDGHNPETWNYIPGRGPFLLRKTLPLELYINDGRIFITRDYSHRNSFPAGSEIIKINGKPAIEILKDISRLISPGSGPRGLDLLDDPRYWAIWNNYKSFRITYKAPFSNQVKEKTASGGLISKIRQMRSNPPRDKYSYSLPGQGIGYMNLETLEGDPEGFKRFLEIVFTHIRDTQTGNLIIDMRRTTGSDISFVPALLGYLLQGSYRISDLAQQKISLQLTNQQPSSESDTLTDLPFLRESDSIDNPIVFNGNIYLLTGIHPSPATILTASALKCNNTGIIIGSDTLGQTTFYAQPYQFIMPGTRIPQAIETSIIRAACSNNLPHGILPDHLLHNSPEGLFFGRDKMIDFALELIDSN
jgi:hypothetical protein